MNISLEEKVMKDRMKSTWMAGDFGQIGHYLEAEAEDFVSRLRISPGAKVLDVACGTGNSAIPAAKAGAAVTGVDIATNLLEQARSRAQSENVQARFEEGDAEDLPYNDGQFDYVVSMFGVMFAPHPEKATAELARVCRPGGVIALANWTPQGFAGKMFATSAKYVPPRADLPPPVLWGEETTVRQRLEPHASSVETTKRTVNFKYPFSPAGTVALFKKYFGPTIVAFSKLGPEDQKSLTGEMENLWSSMNEATDGTTQVKTEYLEVKAVRK
ncbi:MAG: class I SAM-dependent methyltransferase [Acidobacteriota bacterium]|nr:class I SAM-dependent methyltransferase [Acidobacteriota bacterium]